MKKIASFLIIATFLFLGAVFSLDASASEPTCTLVYGYSVTRDWYLGPRGGPSFEDFVDDDKYELRWTSFATLNKWTNPSYSGWTSSIISPCANNANSPDRVIFEIAGYNESAGQIYNDAVTVAGIIRDKYPNVGEVLFHPIVGGPNHELCYYNRRGSVLPVDASYWHPIIDGVIDQLVSEGIASHSTISPEVPDCSMYKDDRGHLTNTVGRAAMAQIIGQYYASQ